MPALKKYDVSKVVEPIKTSPTYGSKKHVTRGYYAGYGRVALKKIGRFEDDDPKLFDLKKELDFIKKFEKCNNILYV